MRAPRADPLTAFEKSELLASVRDIIDDEQVRVSITYAIPTVLDGTNYVVATGLQARNPTTAIINAPRRVVSVTEAAASGGKLQIGDRLYVIDQADLSATPTTNDRITESSVVYAVVRYTQDPLDMIYVVTARKL